MGRLASPAPVRMPYAPGTVVAHIPVKHAIDPRVIIDREIGVRAGYTTFDAAVAAMQGATVGNFPAAAIVEHNGRFHGYSLDSRAAVEFINPGRPPVHARTDSFRFVDENLSAIVDGDRVIFAVQPDGTGV